MSKSIIKIGTIFLVFFLIIGCPDPSNTIIIDDPIAKSFWGNWVRIDGVNELWYFSDSQVTIGSTVYDASTSSSDHSTILSGYTITYKTANMLTVKPESSLEFYLFRKSGASAQISGGVLVSDSYSGRSVSSVRGLGGVGGIDVILENVDNPSNVIEATTDADGNLVFDEVIIDDEYTLEILGEPDITITPEFDGEDIGFITLNNADQNFKVSYQLSSGDHWGYHYMDQSYNLTLRITNFGTADMLSADYQITVPSGMSMSGDSLQNILGTVQANGGVKELDYSISVNSFTEDYEDFDIPIEITSVYGDQWSDIVQLRFFRETMSINVRSESNEVQGIIISPDSNAFAFMTNDKSVNITIPARDSGYILALSGANYDSETKYSIMLNDIPSGNGQLLTLASVYEPNNDETQANNLYMGKEYMGYLGVYDLDFFSLKNHINSAEPSVFVDSPTDDTTPTWSWMEPLGAIEYRYSFKDGIDWEYTSNIYYTPSIELFTGYHILYVQSRSSSGWSDSGNAVVFIKPAVGSIFAGGVVFYMNNSGGGLVAAEYDQSLGIEWGGYGTLIGNTHSSVGSGYLNTMNIVNALGDKDYAAKICLDLELNGFTDWYLPSQEELVIMYESLGPPGINLIDDFYWSSTETGVNTAFYHNFDNYSQYSYTKRTPGITVRAIRTF